MVKVGEAAATENSNALRARKEILSGLAIPLLGSHREPKDTNLKRLVLCPLSITYGLQELDSACTLSVDVAVGLME